ncbi:MAG: hypothetical protein FWF92_07235 [Oscillospiraceae bacterium]|nr:hypothetical protein [Oscillospiraceae bacterium]
MKKIFYIFLIIIILILSSCEDASVPVIHELDMTEDITDITLESIEQEILTEPEETEIITKTTEFSEIIEPVDEKKIIYDALYTVDEIKNIFEADRELFEKIKDIKMPGGYNYFLAGNYPCQIEFYDCNNTNNHIFYDINENSEYKIIFEFFEKYEYIFFIHSIDPDINDYADENLIALFKIQVNLPGFEFESDGNSEYIPWAEIRYNRNSGEIEEKITGEYMTIPLDEYWYYIYSNILVD